MNYAEALGLLAERSETRWELGLGRIRGLLSRLGDPQEAAPAVHVAGTNGKGSFCALLSAVLAEAGYRTGLYTSPHLVEPTERIRVDGAPVSPEAFGALLSAVVDREAEPATYFELLTAAAFLHFRQAAVQAQVVEVGLGGRLDATNALKRPALTVITSIGLDHMEHLGATLEAIAGEKAGILKPGMPVLCGELPPEAMAVIRERAREAGAPVLSGARTPRCESARWEEGVQALEGGLSLRLLGAAAARNAALVLAAVSHLRGLGFGIPDQAVGRAFARLDWPCRFQILHPWPGRTLVLDGAHNPDAMGAFVETWRSSPWSRRPAAFIVGVLRDKDYPAMLRLLAPVARRVIATRPDSPRALDPRELARRLGSLGCEATVAASPERALEAWVASGAEAGAACGSFYLAGRIQGLLEGPCVTEPSEGMVDLRAVRRQP